TLVRSLWPRDRERLFPAAVTLSMFMAQALSADSSCRKAVDDLAIKRLRTGSSPCSTHTGGYCRARQRLPVEMVSTLARTSGALISAKSRCSWLWMGRPVRLVDGTTVSMPDTAANQAAYPQSRGQKPGLGFPICRMVGIVCLSSGAVLNAALGRFRGKGGDEQTLLRTLLDTLDTGDVLLGDAYYATYFLLCELQRRGIDGVFEQRKKGDRFIFPSRLTRPMMEDESCPGWDVSCCQTTRTMWSSAATTVRLSLQPMRIISAT